MFLEIIRRVGTVDFGGRLMSLVIAVLIMMGRHCLESEQFSKSEWIRGIRDFVFVGCDRLGRR